jgi:hypothetical protein
MTGQSVYPKKIHRRKTVRLALEANPEYGFLRWATAIDNLLT